MTFDEILPQLRNHIPYRRSCWPPYQSIMWAGGKVLLIDRRYPDDIRKLPSPHRELIDIIPASDRQASDWERVSKKLE